ncbi:MAG: hypothetical protein JO104_00715 [Candidatus Eremiobacteraeota bacterium]|nr:hypothetical protein [Candidatus Eremiobacteraeota bacterium]
MPKRLLLVLAVAALAIAACHNSSVTPTPSSSPASPVPNPSITKANILVTINGTPQPHVPVSASTPKNTASPRPGTPFKTTGTNQNGIAHFYNLKPSKTYCWVAVIGPIKFSECAGWAVWQSGTIDLGT